MNLEIDARMAAISGYSTRLDSKSALLRRHVDLDDRSAPRGLRIADGRNRLGSHDSKIGILIRENGDVAPWRVHANRRIRLYRNRRHVFADRHAFLHPHVA